MTNEELYELTGRRPIREIIRERQLQFVGHCLRMPEDEPANIYAIYTSNVGKPKQRGKPKISYYDQIAHYLCPDRKIKLSKDEIRKLAQTRGEWKSFIVAPNRPAR
jgi:hypothetical protein